MSITSKWVTKEHEQAETDPTDRGEQQQGAKEHAVGFEAG